jgi:hypothetical protein
MTRAAETAKAIRTTLKQHYPAVGFTVKSRTFSGGNDVSVDWTDGPTEEAINHLLADFEGGSFDPTIDLYTYRTDEPNHPTVKWIITSRHFSSAVVEVKRSKIIHDYKLPEATNLTSDRLNSMINGCWYLGQAIWHELHLEDYSREVTA